MDIDDQRIMALEGIHIWARGVVEQATRLGNLQSQFATVQDFIATRRTFQRERYFFLTAANQLRTHIRWVERLNYLDSAIFEEFRSFEREIKMLRDMNEHVIEYFEGGGRKPDHWWSETNSGKADASTTVDTRIGDRLDWNELAEVASRLIVRLPPMYVPETPAP